MLFPVVIVLALAFGVLLIIPIGGADMPTVIAILNSYAGLSAVAMGFVLDNKLLITAGALDGSSGLILAIIMCKAMNRSFTNVLFGAFGQVQQAKTGGEEKVYKSETVEGGAQVLEQANLVVIIPGYGMAVAQAQHKVRELYDQLKKRGVTVKFAIHPVAGRMPGHMNVLLAEADIPYTDLVEMDEINSDMPQCDVALVVGANDVVNPAARTDKTSPIYGMPIIDADKARTVFAIKRSKNPGFAGIDNELYFSERTWMLFGDAKNVVGELVKQLSGSGPTDTVRRPIGVETRPTHSTREHVCESQSLSLAIILGADLRRPGPGDLSSNRCRFPEVGRWAEYKALYNKKDPYTIRYAVVGSEKRAGKDLKWLELRMMGEKKDANMVYQMLVPGSAGGDRARSRKS